MIGLAGTRGSSPSSPHLPLNQEAVILVQETEHKCLVKETKRRMTPDECPRLNQSQSTKDNNQNEVVKLVMWLMGHHNESSDENKARQALLIDDQLSAEVQVQAGRSDREKRIIIRRWLDWEESPPPFKFDRFTYHDFTSYLSSNVRSNGVPFKGKVYMNKRSILNNLFK